MPDDRISKPTVPPPQRRWDSDGDVSRPVPNVRTSGSSTALWLILGALGGGILLMGLCVFGGVAFFMLQRGAAGPARVAKQDAMAAAPDVAMADKKAAIADFGPAIEDKPNPLLDDILAPNVQPGNRHFERDGGFSYVPPQNWEVRTFGKLKYQIVVGPIADKFAANINFVEEAFDGPLDVYMKATKSNLEKALTKYRLVKDEEFRTTARLVGARLVIENEPGGKKLRQTFYIFPHEKKLVVITCTALAGGGEKLDAQFESCVKTFRFDKK